MSNPVINIVSSTLTVDSSILEELNHKADMAANIHQKADVDSMASTYL